MADGVIVVGSNQRIEVLNTAAETLLGLEVQEAVGRRFVEVVRDHDLQRLVSETTSSEQQRYDEIEVLPSHRFLAVISTPLAEDRVTRGALLTLHDLTRFRQVETTRKEFVSNVSHELRSPLASVKAMVETLENGALEERETARDFVTRIHREVDRMSEMINDLLGLSGLESGTRAFDLTTIDLGPVVRDVVKQFHQRAEVKHIDLRMELPQEDVSVTGDPERLRQVLVNLLDNAVRFTPEYGRVTVSIALVPGFAEVNVTDTGVGIPKEHQPYIFERFYKVDRARSDGGTGLGLAIVKNIVQAHGGEVWVDTEEGNGSTFTFTVPRAT
jgi:two-component system phosphate regulon sensor histidine kinase PhoR